MPAVGLLCRTEHYAAALLSLRGTGGPFKTRTAAVWVLKALFADVLAQQMGCHWVRRKRMNHNCTEHYGNDVA